MNDVGSEKGAASKKTTDARIDLSASTSVQVLQSYRCKEKLSLTRKPV